MVDVWKERWEVRSMTDASKTYTVARKKKDGTMACSCPHWKFHKAPKLHCKHIISILQAVVFVQRRSRIFLDGNREVDALSVVSFPSAAEINHIVGKSSFNMQVAVAGEQFQVKRIFLEE